MKKLGLSTVVVMVGLLTLVVGIAFAGDQDFTLVNMTGLTIDEFYCSPVDTSDWQEDVLGVDTLESGDSVEITFSRDTEDCSWDLKIVDEEGDEIVWTEIDLCKWATITLFYKDGTPTAKLEE